MRIVGAEFHWYGVVEREAPDAALSAAGGNCSQVSHLKRITICDSQ